MSLESFKLAKRQEQASRSKSNTDELIAHYKWALVPNQNYTIVQVNAYEQPFI